MFKVKNLLFSAVALFALQQYALALQTGDTVSFAVANQSSAVTSATIIKITSATTTAQNATDAIIRGGDTVMFTNDSHGYLWMDPSNAGVLNIYDSIAKIATQLSNAYFIFAPHSGNLGKTFSTSPINSVNIKWANGNYYLSVVNGSLSLMTSSSLPAGQLKISW